jgi:hypothetical protein
MHDPGLVAARYEDDGMSSDADRVRFQLLKVEVLGVNGEERLHWQREVSRWIHVLLLGVEQLQGHPDELDPESGADCCWWSRLVLPWS